MACPGKSVNFTYYSTTRELIAPYFATQLLIFSFSGIMFCPVELLTVDGYDMQFGTNVLGVLSFLLKLCFNSLTVSTSGHFFFTELLIPALEEAAKSSPDGHARIVTTSSSGAYLDTLHWETFHDNIAARKKLGTQNLYFQSKFVSARPSPLERQLTDSGGVSGQRGRCA